MHNTTIDLLHKKKYCKYMLPFTHPIFLKALFNKLLQNFDASSRDLSKIRMIGDVAGVAHVIGAGS